jgi:hypothetical protein
MSSGHAYNGVHAYVGHTNIAIICDAEVFLGSLALIRVGEAEVMVKSHRTNISVYYPFRVDVRQTTYGLTYHIVAITVRMVAHIFQDVPIAITWRHDGRYEK